MSEDVFGEMVQFLQSIGPNILPQHLENVIIQANYYKIKIDIEIFFNLGTHVLLLRSV